MSNLSELTTNVEFLEDLKTKVYNFDFSQGDTAIQALLIELRNASQLTVDHVDRNNQWLRKVWHYYAEFFANMLQSNDVLPKVKQEAASQIVRECFDTADLENPTQQNKRLVVYKEVSCKDLLPVIDDEEQQAVFRCVLYDLQNASPTDPLARLYLRHALLANRFEDNFVSIFIKQGTQEQRRKLYQTILPIASEGYLSIPQEYQNDSDIREKFNKYNTYIPPLLLEKLSAILRRELVDGNTEWVLGQMSHLHDINMNILNTPYDSTQPKRVPFNRIFSHFADTFYPSARDPEQIRKITTQLLTIADKSDGLLVLRTIIESPCVPLQQQEEALMIFLSKYNDNFPFLEQPVNDRSFYLDNYFFDIFLSLIQNRQTHATVRTKMQAFLMNLSTNRFTPPQQTDKKTSQESFE